MERRTQERAYPAAYADTWGTASEALCSRARIVDQSASGIALAFEDSPGYRMGEVIQMRVADAPQMRRARVLRVVRGHRRSRSSLVLACRWVYRQDGGRQWVRRRRRVVRLDASPATPSMIGEGTRDA